jgi:hypothetical protein
MTGNLRGTAGTPSTNRQAGEGIRTLDVNLGKAAPAEQTARDSRETSGESDGR